MGNKKGMSLIDAPKFDENPFVAPAIDVVEEKTIYKQKYGNRVDQKGISAVVDTSTGEIFQTSFIRRVEIDEDKFAKLYLEQVSLLNDLSTPGIRVFTYLIKITKPNRAEVIFRLEDCMTHCKYKSKATIYKGLAELIEAQIIARGWADNIYFINPLVFFNGNRVVFATEYVKKQHPEAENTKTLHTALRRVEAKRLEDKSKQYPTMDEALFPDGENPID